MSKQTFIDAQFYQERFIMQGITAMKKPEYSEGPKALENFERGMEALFQVPKKSTPLKKKARSKRAKTVQSRTSESGPSRDSGEA
jgi:hypothetical protein